MVNAMFIEVESHSRHAEFRSLGVNFFLDARLSVDTSLTKRVE